MLAQDTPGALATNEWDKNLLFRRIGIARLDNLRALSSCVVVVQEQHVLRTILIQRFLIERNWNGRTRQVDIDRLDKNIAESDAWFGDIVCGYIADFDVLGAIHRGNLEY